ncbi:MAG TPA: hypothetical protein VM327_04210 [Candidatus Thermoplasmatota archaeon]|nr:hypothetical protein [Candidatus Thermoplasmatota archaeon]
MNTKLLTGAGCLLLLAAAIAPGVLGHDERTSLDAAHAALGAVNNGVSGRYVGAAGPAVAVDAYTNPDDTLATGSMLCDGEVAVDQPGFALNEQTVDGGSGGLVPDTVDDGGQGGACHVATYQTNGGGTPADNYNTPGCLPTTNWAAGYDLLGDNWLAATCDYQTVEGGESSLEVLLACVVNEVVLQTDVTALEPCVLAFVDCTLDPTCQDGAVSCGADGFADGIHFGYGSGANGAKAFFPSNPCSGVATSGIFVWEMVGTNAGLPAAYPVSVGDVYTN